MFENMVKFLKKFNKKEKNVANNSKDAAKERLHLVLMQDRANVSADFLELMKQEIIEVIKKYIEVDESAIDVRLTNKENEDGTNGAPALYANIPILNIKNEARKIDKKENKEEENKKDNIDKKDKNNDSVEKSKKEEDKQKAESKSDDKIVNEDKENKEEDKNNSAEKNEQEESVKEKKKENNTKQSKSEQNKKTGKENEKVKEEVEHKENIKNKTEE